MNGLHQGMVYSLYISNYSLNRESPIILPFACFWNKKKTFGNACIVCMTRLLYDTELISWEQVRLSG